MQETHRTPFTEPIDQLHADCLAARDTIRAQFLALHSFVARWQPRPYPRRDR